MPKATDWSSIWWAEGFPGVVEGAPWMRVVESGHYAMVLDTGTMKVPHFGTTRGRSWKELPPAELRLKISVNGKSYTCTGSEGWSRHGGPRLVEAGRFFQRADVTGLIFKSEAGEELSVNARFETAAWADRLGLIFEAQPGTAPIVKGEGSFGKVGGGFGLDGTNDFSVPEAAKVDPNSFTWSFWAFVPEDYRSATKANPWMMCQGRNEWAGGNVGMMILGDRVVATMNVGGGRDKQVTVTAGKVRVNEWSHFLLSYDGENMRIFMNGGEGGSARVGAKRQADKGPMIFGRRGDGSGDGYHFRGVIDEIRLFNGVVDPGQLGGAGKVNPLGKWSFREDGMESGGRPKMKWENPSLSIGFSDGKLLNAKASSQGKSPVSLVIDPVRFNADLPLKDPVKVDCDHPVKYERDLGWHRINLDRVKPIGTGNDVIDRVPFTLTNQTKEEQVARLMFEKTGRGFRGRLGSPITGVSAILCDENGEPTGIPIQLSKNWHNEAAAGVYKGTWFHGITQVRVPAGKTMRFQVVIANGHWGGVAAASQAQLSLIGWGSNQRWEQSALGCWGESICYEPAQGQANCTITDVRPLMVTPMNSRGKWSWTSNVGGGDFFRIFDAAGKRVAHQAMKTKVHRQGPCLTEVEFSGRIGKGIHHSITTSLGRTDDIVRGSYRLRMDVTKAVDFSRFVIFQVGADTYNFTREGRFVLGNGKGVQLEKMTEPGGNVYRMKPTFIPGATPWVSMEQGKPGNQKNDKGAWANRGIIVREWKARLGGKEAGPHFAEHGMERRGARYSTVDLVPPSGVKRLEPGDFVEAVIEYVVMPQAAEDYYGPNESLREALTRDGGAWEMIHREAVGNNRLAMVEKGTLLGTFPDVRVKCHDDEARMKLKAGIGYVPVTFTGLSQHEGFALKVNGEVLDQSVHGNDFWQTDYDPESETWSRTYNLPRDGRGEIFIKFGGTRK